jgi:hypothetical protein
MKYLATALNLVIALLLTASAQAKDAGPPASFFVGQYEIVGRSPGQAGPAYSGWAVVTLDGEALSIVRCIAGKESRGRLAFAAATADRIRVIRTRFTLGGEALEATCQIHVDLDNYARLTCYTYPVDQPAIATPGIEALFHAKWAAPGSAATCP